MALSVKHAFQSAISDSGDASLVQPSNWNAEHGLTATDGKLLGASGSTTVGEITVGSGLSLSAGTLSAASFRGALVVKSASDTSVNSGGDTIIGWNAETYDTDGFHDNASQNSRLTIPSGVTKVRLRAQVTLSDEGTAAVHVWFVHILKNGSFDYAGRASASDATGAVDTIKVLNVVSPVLEVTAGDYFEVDVFQTSGETLAAQTSAGSWFAIEVVA